ncbi:Reverse transcriptase, RNA-dependent DNA polymerase [Cucumis melo var. makuwa]|uniref:Reverse transcriptase, RNA-dependent DNA polymerase n=1 Tax=Cucumis melo var. makuwa TaxID=1194695 RepID=A0A5A7VGQ3_CUCMM|nr:Reverse transcriptase, RNA-dependent DNA polymerase [Cucumis melo var. makuwa]TYK00938.1 Reverse transcriptase, RNA-dependent DNA polymerase [Cucumis melo var. makuwa]
MSGCKAVSTPLASHFRLSSSQCPVTEQERPDLGYAMSMINRFMSNLGKEHWKAVKWTLLEGSTHADYAADLDKRFLSGNIFAFMSAIHLSKNPSHHERSKHIDVKFHYIRNVIAQKDVELVNVHTVENLSDMLTKVLSAHRFKYLLDELNVKSG